MIQGRGMRARQQEPSLVLGTCTYTFSNSHILKFSTRFNCPSSTSTNLLIFLQHVDSLLAAQHMSYSTTSTYFPKTTRNSTPWSLFAFLSRSHVTMRDALHSTTTQSHSATTRFPRGSWIQISFVASKSSPGSQRWSSALTPQFNIFLYPCLYLFGSCPRYIGRVQVDRCFCTITCRKLVLLVTCVSYDVWTWVLFVRRDVCLWGPSLCPSDLGIRCWCLEAQVWTIRATWGYSKYASVCPLLLNSAHERELGTPLDCVHSLQLGTRSPSFPVPKDAKSFSLKPVKWLIDIWLAFLSLASLHSKRAR